jgi:ABC-type transport system involved in cytochrome bd biosynthesis fused ATPase/permease subunit
VLENGRIIERGTHQELLKHNGPYTRLYDLQLREQEEFETRLLQTQPEEKREVMP